MKSLSRVRAWRGGARPGSRVTGGAESPIAFKRDLALCKAAVPASALVPGIAACADEASPDRDSVRAQLEAADALKGVSFFALDWALGALCGYTDVKP